MVNATATERLFLLEFNSLYQFAVTAWNEWGESSKEQRKMKIVRVTFENKLEQKHIPTPGSRNSGEYENGLLRRREQEQQDQQQRQFRIVRILLRNKKHIGYGLISSGNQFCSLPLFQGNWRQPRIHDLQWYISLW